MVKSVHVALVLFAAVVACKKGADSDTKKADADTGSGAGSESGSESSAQVGTVDLSTDPLSSLGLSESVSPKVPESVSATGKGVSVTQTGTVNVALLTAKHKSVEACYIRQSLRDSKMQLDSVGYQLCTLEAQKGMKAGGKYKMTMSGGASGAPSSGGPGAPSSGGPGTPTTGGPDGTPTTGGPGGPTSLALQGGATAMPDGGPGGATMGPTGGATMGPTGGATMGQTAGATGGTTAMPDGAPGGATAGATGGGSAPDMGSGDQTLSVFLDNSVPKQFTVYVCANDKLTQKVVLTDAANGRSKGSYKTKMDMNGFDMEMQGAFDNGVGVAGRQRTSTQMSFHIDMGQMSTYVRSRMDLDVADGKVSVVRIASEESTKAGEFGDAHKELGVALIGPNLGAALFQRTVSSDYPSIFAPGGDAGSGSTEDAGLDLAEKYETSRAYFDNAGYSLGKTASKAFESGGVLAVDEKLLPKLAADNFKVDFDAGDWDCSGTEDFTMDTTSDAYKACDDKFAIDFSQETCTDAAAYAPGFVATDVPDGIDARESSDAPALDPNSIAPDPNGAPAGGAPTGDAPAGGAPTGDTPTVGAPDPTQP